MLNKIQQPILITGASGFIGSNLLRFFVSKNIRVNIILRKKSSIWRIKDIIDKTKIFYADLREKENLSNVIRKIKPKSIFHLSAYGAYSHQNQVELIKSSILDSTVNLINECKKYKFNIFINTGSNSEYGFRKEKMNENDLVRPNSDYALFKAASTLFCQQESIANGLPIITVRPFHVYGPYEEPTRLIPTLIRNLLKNKNSRLVSPDIARDLIFVDDAINLYLKIASKPNVNGDIFNIGTGKQRTIKEIYSNLNKLLNCNIKPKWNSMKRRRWDQKIWKADMSKVKKKFNWKPKHNLIQGLIKTISWHKKFYN
jgi:nucleoside-diphosphate-sugar epimerase